MKKSTYIKRAVVLLLLCLMAGLTLSLSVAADSEVYYERVKDSADLLDYPDASNLNQRMKQLSKEYDVELYFVTYQSNGDGDDYTGDDFCRDVCDIRYSDAILLIVTYDTSDEAYDYDMYTYGDAYSAILDEEVDVILDAVYDDIKDGQVYEGANAFFWLSASAYNGQVCDRVVDPANLLGGQDASRLNAHLQQLSEEYEVELYFATYRASGYDDDYIGVDFCRDVCDIRYSDAILLIVTYDTSDGVYYYDMYTYGYPDLRIWDQEVDIILDQDAVYDNIKGGRVYEGAEAFFEWSLKAYVGRVSTSWAVIITVSAVISLAIGLAVCAGVVASYRKKKASVDYPLDRFASLELTHEADKFVKEYTTRTYTPRSESSGGGSGGSSSHGGGSGHRGGR